MEQSPRRAVVNISLSEVPVVAGAADQHDSAPARGAADGCPAGVAPYVPFCVRRSTRDVESMQARSDLISTGTQEIPRTASLLDRSASEPSERSGSSPAYPVVLMTLLEVAHL
jgi:hypothetical protein